MKNLNWNRIITLTVLVIMAIVLAQTLKQSGKSEKKDNIKEQTFNSKDSLDVEKVEIINLGELKSTNLYTKNCKFCHGNDGSWDGIKARVNPDICPYDLSKESKPDKFIYVILNGQDKMPSHERLNDTNIKVLIVYIKKFRK